MDKIIYELNQRYYRSKEPHDFDEDEQREIDFIYHQWNMTLLKDYKEFNLDKEQENFNFDLVTKYSNKIGTSKIEIFRLRDSLELDPEIKVKYQDALNILIGDYHKEIRKYTDYDHVGVSSTKGPVMVFIKFLVYKKLLIITAPKDVSIDSLEKNYEVEFYLVDIITGEYPPYLENINIKDSKINMKMLNLIFNACRETKDKLEEEFTRCFSKNVYRACGLDLKVIEKDLLVAINNCTKESSTEIDMTDFFQILIQDFAYLFRKNHSRKASSSSIPGSFLTPALTTSPSFSEIKFEKQKSDLHIEPRMFKDKLNIEVYEELVESLINVFFKKLEVAGVFIEQTQTLDSLINESNHYVRDFIKIIPRVN
jgi:hypothetical protein